MSKQDTGDMLKFMLRYNDGVKAAALWLRDFVWDIYPDANELIYAKNYTLAFGWTPTDKAGDVFCSIALFTDHLNFGFNRGSEIPDKEKRLLGNGSLYRYIRVRDRDDFPEDYIKSLLAIAFENSISGMKPQKVIVQGQTIVKAVVQKKREGF